MDSDNYVQPELLPYDDWHIDFWPINSNLVRVRLILAGEEIFDRELKFSVGHRLIRHLGAAVFDHGGHIDIRMPEE
ncbi:MULTISPECIES: hypothetical protein [unclassified Inquilinus]|uniref:hypothetical protein n=1 Tax=unclassified Inquilinus TaxID=2645927 RepID=UPI003F8F62D8